MILGLNPKHIIKDIHPMERCHGEADFDELHVVEKLAHLRKQCVCVLGFVLRHSRGKAQNGALPRRENRMIGILDFG